mmetsp:Transcript_17514/g.43605  ORF Transcript_17514/g.43605 Transcript_17514/m.43605 type:complete len:241 (-) Transcript_17514:5651-6373(-)
MIYFVAILFRSRSCAMMKIFFRFPVTVFFVRSCCYTSTTRSSTTGKIPLFQSRQVRTEGLHQRIVLFHLKQCLERVKVREQRRENKIAEIREQRVLVVLSCSISAGVRSRARRSSRSGACFRSRRIFPTTSGPSPFLSCCSIISCSSTFSAVLLVKCVAEVHDLELSCFSVHHQISGVRVRLKERVFLFVEGVVKPSVQKPVQIASDGAGGSHLALPSCQVRFSFCGPRLQRDHPLRVLR